MPTSLAVTAKGQVTLKRELLTHLGIQPGQRIELEKLPGGELRIRAAKPTRSIDGFIGLLAGKGAQPLSIEQMNELIARGWAGEE